MLSLSPTQIAAAAEDLYQAELAVRQIDALTEKICRWPAAHGLQNWFDFARDAAGDED